MKRLVTAALAMAFLAISAPGASAQVNLGVAGGVTIPTSDYGDYAKTGWLGHVDLSIPIGDAGLAAGASGYFGSNSHDGTDDKTNLYGALGFLAYGFDTGGALMPSIFAMAGSMTHAYKSETFGDESETGFAYGGGVSLGFPLGGVVGLVQGWYLGASIGDPSSTTAIIGVDVGVQFALGGGM
jgi:hypothetical protein